MVVISTHQEHRPRRRSRASRAGAGAWDTHRPGARPTRRHQVPGAPRFFRQTRNGPRHTGPTYVSGLWDGFGRTCAGVKPPLGELSPMVCITHEADANSIALCVTKYGKVTSRFGCFGVFTWKFPDALLTRRTCLMKRWNVAALRDAPQRGVQDPATDPERPPLPCIAGAAVLDAGLKTEPANGGSDLPRRAIRRCRMKGVHLERNKPVHAAGTAADGTTAGPSFYTSRRGPPCAAA